MKWNEEVDNLTGLVAKGITMEKIGEIYGVSRQRVYQVLEKFGIDTPQRKRKSFLKGKDPKYYWLNKMLCKREIPKTDRLMILENIEVPDYCPCLDIKLNYDGTGREGYSRNEDSPSLDRIDSSKGYSMANIQIISWRANRIKNDSTPEELLKIATYMKRFIS